MARITLTRSEFDSLRDRYDDVRSSYGGRGMYGKTCLGYVGSEPHLFIFDLARLLAERDMDGPLYADDIRYEIESLGFPSTDSMGFDTIYYFRSIEVEPGDEEDDDDE